VVGHEKVTDLVAQTRERLRRGLLLYCELNKRQQDPGVSSFCAIAPTQNLASTDVQCAVGENHGLRMQSQRGGLPMDRPVTAMRAFRFYTPAQCYRTGRTPQRARWLPIGEVGLFQYEARPAPSSPASVGTPRP